MRGIVTNLLQNAAEAAGPSGTVRVVSRSGSGLTTIEVHDSGPGLSREAARTLFEPTITFKAHGMGQMLDLVPNHMGVLGADNGWWLDVLENGQSSAYAEYFDIEWNPVKEELRGKVLVPVLGAPYAR